MGEGIPHAIQTFHTGALTRKGTWVSEHSKYLDMSLEGLEVWTYAIYSLRCYIIALHPVTVNAMEVLIKYCMNSFPQVDQFIRIQIYFYFLCVSYWSIGSETKSNWLI